MNLISVDLLTNHAIFHFSFLGWMMGLSASIQFSGKNDLIIQDDCDKSVRKICQMNSGWNEELDAIEVQVLEA